MGLTGLRLSTIDFQRSTRRTSHVYIAHRTSHVARRTSHIARGTSHVARRASHIAYRASRIAHRTSREHIAHRTTHIAHIAPSPSLSLFLSLSLSVPFNPAVPLTRSCVVRVQALHLALTAPHAQLLVHKGKVTGHQAVATQAGTNLAAFLRHNRPAGRGCLSWVPMRLACLLGEHAL